MWLQYSVLIHLYHGFICLYMHACVCMLICMCSCHTCIYLNIPLQMCILCVCLCACMSDTRAIYTIGLSDSAIRKIVPPDIGYLNHIEVFWIHFMPLDSPGVCDVGDTLNTRDQARTLTALFSWRCCLSSEWLNKIPTISAIWAEEIKRDEKTAFNPNNAHQTCNHLNAHQ